MNEHHHFPIVKTLLTVAVLAAVLVGGMQIVYAGKILPGVKVGPMNVSGKSQSDAAAEIATRISAVKELHFRYQDRTITIPAASVGLKVDAAKTAANAAALGRGTAGDVAGAPLRAAFQTADVPLVYSINEQALADALQKQAGDIGTPLKDAEIVRVGTTFQIKPAQNGYGLDARAAILAARTAIEDFQSTTTLPVRTKVPAIQARDLTATRAYASAMVAAPLTVTASGKSFSIEPQALASWISFAQTDTSLEGPILDRDDSLKAFDAYVGVGQDDAPFVPLERKNLFADLDREKVGQYVAQVGEEVDHPPVNARLSFTGGALAVTGQPRDGTVVDRPQAVTSIQAAVRTPKRLAALPVVAKQADIRQETLPQLGINTLIGTSTTHFGGSPYERIYNIRVGANKFDGILIKPGQEFSFDDQLGDVGPETGYIPGLVILQNKTVPQYGGGLCQVSTTMFRAALAAGLPITARTPHSYAVQWYAPLGMDATIYPPYPDMKFINNTGHYILVQTHQEGVSLTYDFYGTSDGRKASTQILTQNATEEAGGTASFRYIVEGGPNPIDRVFFSSYQPHSNFPVGGAKSLN